MRQASLSALQTKVQDASTDDFAVVEGQLRPLGRRSTHTTEGCHKRRLLVLDAAIAWATCSPDLRSEAERLLRTAVRIFDYGSARAPVETQAIASTHKETIATHED